MESSIRLFQDQSDEISDKNKKYKKLRKIAKDDPHLRNLIDIREKALQHVINSIEKKIEACDFCDKNLDAYHAKDNLTRAEFDIDIYIENKQQSGMSPRHKSPSRKSPSHKSPSRKSYGRSNTSTSIGGSRKRNIKSVRKTRRIRKRLYRSKK
jgi:hypothetical protein